MKTYVAKVSGRAGATEDAPEARFHAHSVFEADSPETALAKIKDDLSRPSSGYNKIEWLCEVGPPIFSEVTVSK